MERVQDRVSPSQTKVVGSWSWLQTVVYMYMIWQEQREAPQEALVLWNTHHHTIIHITCSSYWLHLEDDYLISRGGEYYLACKISYWLHLQDDYLISKGGEDYLAWKYFTSTFKQKQIVSPIIYMYKYPWYPDNCFFLGGGKSETYFWKSLTHEIKWSCPCGFYLMWFSSWNL